jgi:hypothetical protein
MNKKFPVFRISQGEAGRFGVRSPVWPGLLATLIVLGMLMAFHQVVRGAVQQGELRQQAIATHAAATWRCNALNGTAASGSCLSQLNTPIRDGSLLFTLKERN